MGEIVKFDELLTRDGTGPFQNESTSHARATITRAICAFRYPNTHPGGADIIGKPTFDDMPTQNA